MLELGTSSKVHHRKLGRSFVKANIDGVFTFGRLAREIQSVLPKSMFSFHAQSRAQLHQKLNSFIQAKDCVLVKGSRSMEMEKTVQFIKKNF